MHVIVKTAGGKFKIKMVISVSYAVVCLQGR